MFVCVSFFLGYPFYFLCVPREKSFGFVCTAGGGVMSKESGLLGKRIARQQLLVRVRLIPHPIASFQLHGRLFHSLPLRHLYRLPIFTI